MKAILEAQVELWDIAVFAELAVWESRPDLQLLCKEAAKNGGLDDDAVDRVLPGLSSRGRKNLVRHLGYIQLLERDGALTRLGRHCADSGDAPAWEQGTYHLLVAAHPLFGCHVLDHKRTVNDPFDRDYNLDPLPTWMRVSQHQIFTSALDKSRRFSIAAFPAARGQDPTCRGWEMKPGTLRWEIDLETGRNHWTVEGDVGAQNNPRPFVSAPESADPSDLVGLYAKWEPKWDARTGRVLIAYDGHMGKGGRETFLRAWRYDSVQVGRFGTYENVVVRDVPVGPRTDAEAKAWATAIAVARVEASEGYVSTDGWRNEWESATSGTPLEGRAGSAPDPRTIATSGTAPVAARTRWLLSAAADIGLGA